MLYVCNVDEGDAADGNALSARVFEKAAAEGAQAVVISAAIEAEIATWPPKSATPSSRTSACTRPASTG